MRRMKISHCYSPQLRETPAPPQNKIISTFPLYNLGRKKCVCLSCSTLESGAGNLKLLKKNMEHFIATSKTKLCCDASTTVAIF